MSTRKPFEPIEIDHYSLSDYTPGDVLNEANAAIAQDKAEYERIQKAHAETFAELHRIADEKLEEARAQWRSALDQCDYARAERDKWKDEYENLCKFATQYEQERDTLRAENKRLSVDNTAKGINNQCLNADKTELRAQLVEAQDLLLRCSERLDDSDPSDELYVNVNEYLAKYKKQGE